MHLMYSYPNLSIKQVHIMYYSSKNYAFLFSFQTRTGSQWEGPQNNNKATCSYVCNPDSLCTVLYLIYHFYAVYLCNKCYQTSPIYTFVSFSPKNSQFKQFLAEFNLSDGSLGKYGWSSVQTSCNCH